MMRIYIKTERAMVRNLDRRDLETVFRYRNSAECAKYQRWDDTSADAIASLIDRHCNDVFLSDKAEQHYAVSLKNNVCIGELAYFYTAADACITLGITVSPEYQGRGYAYEILKAVVACIQKQHPQTDIVALIEPENQKSIGLFSKLGFERECYAPSISSYIYTVYGKKE